MTEPIEVPTAIRERLADLLVSHQPQLDLAGVFVRGAFRSPLDLLAMAVLHRSLNLLTVCASMIELKLSICAAPLFRLQIDNCMRFHAAALVDDADAFALYVLAGKPIRKMMDRDGNIMTDKFLVRSLSRTAGADWLPVVYDNLSGFETHVFSAAVTAVGTDDERTIDLLISDRDALYSEHLHEELIEAFAETTDLLIKLVDSWAISRGSPADEPDAD